MSTRVEKGNTKFKPVIRPKVRPSATPAPQDRVRQSVEPAVPAVPTNPMPPPSIIPERAISVTPQSQDLDVSGSTDLPRTSQIIPLASQPSQSIPRASQPPQIISRASQPPQIISRASQPPQIISRASQPPQIITQSVTSNDSGSLTAAVSIPMPSRSSTAAVVIPMPSREPSVIAIPEGSRPRATPIPSPQLTTTSTPASKGKKRAEPEPETPPASNANTIPQDRVAQKRPKLAILQAEADRVKNKPPRRAKSKKTTANNDAEVGDNVDGQDSQTESVRRKRKVSTKKKPTAEAENTLATEEAQPKRPRAKRKAAEKDTQIELSDNGELTDAASESSPPRKKRRRRAATDSTEPPDTAEPIDPTQTTMSAICDDLGSGRISSRWQSSQILYAEARKRAREERARAFIEADERERETGRATGKRTASTKQALPTDNGNIEEGEEMVDKTDQNPDEFNYNESLKASHYAPQVRIGANGEVVLDMDSLQVDRAADPEFIEEYNHIEENDHSRYTNSNSWSKRRMVRWGKEDTALFYNALRQFGQNFDLIARILPGRTYQMCKNKFKAEDKKHPSLIDEALKNSVAVDLETLSRMTGKDFSGPTPIIKARKVMTLAEDDDSREDTHTKQVEAVITEGNVQSSALDDADGVVVTTRDSASPPPPEALLNNPPRASASSEVLSTIDSGSVATTARGVSGPITIQPPTRTIPVPSRTISRKPIQADSPTASTSSAPPLASTSKTSIPVKKRGKKGLQEDGVEILGLINDHIEE